MEVSCRHCGRYLGDASNYAIRIGTIFICETCADRTITLPKHIESFTVTERVRKVKEAKKLEIVHTPERG